MKLHEITNEIQELLDTLVDHEGEMCPEVAGQLGQLEALHKDKVDGYCKAVRILETQAAGALAELDRLNKLYHARSKSAVRLKDWLKENMQRLGQTKIETGIFVVRIQRNGRPSISFDGDCEHIPEAFRKVTISVDGDAAYQAWREGELPDGFTVKQGSHLRIQ